LEIKLLSLHYYYYYYYYYLYLLLFIIIISLLSDDLSIVKERDCKDVGMWKNEYIKGGNNLCQTVKIYPGLSKCFNNDIYWCKQHSYDMTEFIGGVSNMFTQIFLNTICNK